MSRKSPFLLMILTLLCAAARGAEPFTPAESLSYERCDTGIRITGLLNGTLTQLNLPPEIDGLPVAEIEQYAFCGYEGLTSVTIPKGVTVIDVGTFDECTGLTSVTIPEGVTVIGQEAFNACEGLTSVTIPESVTEIGFEAFNACRSLTSVTIPAGVTKFDGFTLCTSLTSVAIPESVTVIGWGALAGCESLTSVAIPESVTVIKKWAFSECTGLTSVTIPKNVTEIGAMAFEGCAALTGILCDPENPNFKSVDGVLFSKDGKTLVVFPGGISGTYTIPEGVTAIAEWAFASCTGLTSVNIPDSVTKIGFGAFWSCKGLTIHAPAGSAAERFAKENGIPFAAE